MLSISSGRLACTGNRQLVEEKIASAKAKIENINTELCGLYQLLNTSSLAAMLPLEILAEIFLFAAESEFAKRPTSNKLPMPILIGRVCRAWREAAWTTTPLWKNLVVNLRPSLRGTTSSQQVVITEWVQRSGNQPLNLVLKSFPPTRQDQEEGCPLEIFQPLLDVSRRWRRFQTEGWGPGFHALQKKLQEPLHFTLLSEISMSASDWPPSSAYRWNFRAAPLLVDVEMYDVLPVSLRLDWGRLTSFSGRVDLAAGFFVMKGASETLEVCSLDLVPPRFPITSARAITRVHLLENLVSLSIKLQDNRHEWVDLISLFQHLEVPELTSLGLTLNGADLRDLLPSLNDLALRSEFELEHLTLVHPDISEHALLVFLATLPSLTHFDLKSDKTRQLFSDLTVSMLDPASLTDGRSVTECLPCLTRFDYSGFISFSPEKLITMLANRLKSSTEKSGGFVDYIDNINIKYYNKSWAQERDPNVIREFHRQLDAQNEFFTEVDIIWTQ